MPATATAPRPPAEAPAPALLEIMGLSVQFGRQEVLRDISLSIPEGQTLVILGESGCGKTVLLKRSAQGAMVFTRDEEFAVPGYSVNEVDPTGAGDTFCAGLTVAVLDGLPLRQAARFANAVGALAVTRKGPMEGAPTRAEVEALMASQQGG